MDFSSSDGSGGLSLFGEDGDPDPVTAPGELAAAGTMAAVLASVTAPATAAAVAAPVTTAAVPVTAAAVLARAAPQARCKWCESGARQFAGLTRELAQAQQKSEALQARNAMLYRDLQMEAGRAFAVSAASFQQDLAKLQNDITAMRAAEEEKEGARAQERATAREKDAEKDAQIATLRQDAETARAQARDSLQAANDAQENSRSFVGLFRTVLGLLGTAEGLGTPNESGDSPCAVPLSVRHQGLIPLLIRAINGGLDKPEGDIDVTLHQTVSAVDRESGGSASGPVAVVSAVSAAAAEASVVSARSRFP